LSIVFGWVKVIFIDLANNLLYNFKNVFQS